MAKPVMLAVVLARVAAARDSLERWPTKKMEVRVREYWRRNVAPDGRLVDSCDAGAVIGEEMGLGGTYIVEVLF